MRRPQGANRRLQGCHSGLCAKRLELGIGMRPYVGAFPAFRRRKPEQMHGFVFRTALQCQFASEEIRLADSALFCIGVWIVRGGKYGLGRYLAEIELDDRGRPFGHVDLRHGLDKSARLIAAPVHDVAPQSGVGVLGIDLARLIKVG
jgi:hypothetical protein